MLPASEHTHRRVNRVSHRLSIPSQSSTTSTFRYPRARHCNMARSTGHRLHAYALTLNAFKFQKFRMWRTISKNSHIMLAVFVPLAACGVIWVHRHIQGGSTSKTASGPGVPASNNESNGCDTMSNSQQSQHASGSTLSAQPTSAPVMSNNSNSSRSSSQHGVLHSSTLGGYRAFLLLFVHYANSSSLFIHTVI